ncbi:uncharacterized protein FFM5_15328 [Fusarium fujikuroi]|nr:uncharacterized protein FFM5_15328 [Fusarium fujikuroi]
MLGFICYVS